MDRLSETIIHILDRAHKSGKDNLSRFEVQKIVYLLEVYSLKYTGLHFLKDTSFVREKNGPISINVYHAMDRLVDSGNLKKEEKENDSYGHPRHCFSLAKEYSNTVFNEGELLFADSILAELFKLNQKELKERAYSTEPMEEITKQEKGSIGSLKGTHLVMSHVKIDPDVVDMYS